MEKNSVWYLAGIGLIGVVVGIIFVGILTSVVHWAGTPKFCGEFCHSMDATYIAYQKGDHFRTASGVSPRRHRVVRYLLADERGRWLGTGWGSLRVSGVPVGKLRFLRSGTLHCRVYHLMKTPRLQGIDDVGVRLSRL